MTASSNCFPPRSPLSATKPWRSFFTLSGFVLVYAHVRDNELNVSLERFWLARIIRLFPAYLLGLLIAFPFVAAAIVKSHHFDFLLLLVPPMLQSWWPPASLLWNAPAWSLSDEAFFYAVFPFACMYLCRMRPTTAVGLTCFFIAVSSAVRFFIPDTTEASHDLSAYFPLLNLPQFLFGMALGLVFLKYGPARQGRTMFVVALLATLTIIWKKNDIAWATDPAILCPVFGLLIYSLASVEGFLHRCLSTTSLMSLGEASYSLYILHGPIWLWWDRVTRVQLKLDLPVTIDFSAYLCVVIACSFGALFLIENPVRKRTLSRKPVLAAQVSPRD